jgi:hypothetical protein
MRVLLICAAALLVTCSSVRLVTDMMHGGVFQDRSRPDAMLRFKSFEQTFRNNSKTQEQQAKCQDMEARFRFATTDRKPVVVAGYPGSGNSMTRTLVEKLTGFDTADLYDQQNCSSNRVATCKTHFPVFDIFPPEPLRSIFAPTAVLLIRNPADALPSFFNVVWEGKHAVGFHSQQGSEEEWKQWRDENFDVQIELWYKLLVYWFKEWYIQTVLPYELLTDSQEGPLIVQQLARQLESAGFQVAPDPDCQWYDTVFRLAYSKRAPHRYRPSYTHSQKRKLLQVINRALVVFDGHLVMTPILNQYMLDIASLVNNS